MASTQHLTGTSTPHLDGYINGIRDEFDRLNHELDETRKQRDEYITKYRSQVKELQELRKSISSRENNTVSPVSTSNEYNGEDAPFGRLHNPENSKKVAHIEDGLDGRERDGSYQNQVNDMPPPITGTAPLPIRVNVPPANEPGYSAWDVELNSNTTAELNLDLVHKLTQKGRKRGTFSTDGKYLATASGLGVVSIFYSKTGERIMHSVMKDLHRSLPAYKCLCFSPDSKYLATGDEEGNVLIWIISQRRVRSMFRHRHAVRALNFSPNGRSIVTCSQDKTIIIWRLRDGSSRVLAAFEDYPRSVRFSPDGRYIASGENLGGMQIWNVRTGKLVARWQGHSGLVASLVFTPDGKGLLSGSWDKQITQWDVSLLSSLGMANPPISGMKEISRLIGHTDSIMTISISPDGKWIASGSWDDTVRIWNAHEATLHYILHCPGWVWSVDFSPVGNCLAIGGDFEDITVWNYVNP